MDRTGRALTTGEVALLRSVFGEGIAYDAVRVHAQRWFWPLSNRRAMAPNGHLYLPGGWHAACMAAGGVHRAALLAHEGAHLFQHYALGWRVWLRGAVDRRYGYRLVPGRRFEEYGLEQMGMIAQHWFTLRSGREVPGLPYTLADYDGLMPVTD